MWKEMKIWGKSEREKERRGIFDEGKEGNERYKFNDGANIKHLQIIYIWIFKFHFLKVKWRKLKKNFNSIKILSGNICQ